MTWLCQAFVSSSRLFHVGFQSLLDVPPAFAGLATVVVAAYHSLLQCEERCLSLLGPLERT